MTRRLAALAALTAVLLTGCTSQRPAAGHRPPQGSPAPGSVTTAPATGSAAPAPGTPAPGTSAPGTSAPGAGVLSAWRSCESGFSCAELTVPLDTARPALGTVALALTRTPATDHAHRIGSLLVNPGGPGESAVGYLQQAAFTIPADVRARFDLVAFDPRGVGRTAPVRCRTTAELDTFFHLDPAPASAAGLAALGRSAAELAAGCARRSGRILRYVATSVVAQDMDRVRAALGDAKLTYLGYSYGTSIGAAYLEQFPTHVRAMVLDGALDPTLSWDQLSAGQAKGFDVALAAFLADCQANGCAFRQAVSGPLLPAYDRLAAQVASQPLPGHGSRRVGKAEFALGVLYGLYDKRLWPSISAGLVAAVHGQGAVLLALNDGYLRRTGAGYANVIEANYAVNCVDVPWPHVDAPYVALAVQVGRHYPRFGPTIALGGIGCEHWPVPPTGRPHAVRAPTAPPVLVVGTTRDPATPYAWAVGLAHQLAHGVLLTHEGDGHTAYRAGAKDCLVGPVNRYLLTAQAPAPATC